MQGQLSNSISCFLTFALTLLFVKVSRTKYLIFLQVTRVLLIFHSGGSMTNPKVYQGFHDDKMVEEHSSKWEISKTKFFT